MHTETHSETRAGDIRQIWDLGDLYQGLDDPCLLADQQNLEQALEQFEHRFAPRLEQVLQEPELLAQALDEYTRIHALLHNQMVYALLEWNVATQDTAINSFRDKLNRAVSEWSNRLEFFRQGLSQLEAAQLDFLREHAGVERYGAFLQKVRRFQPYQLSEAEERLMQLMRTYSRQRWLDFYTQTTSTWMFAVGDQDLTEDQASDCLRRTDADLRLAGYESVYRHYQSKNDFIGYIYNTLIQEYAQEASLRGFASTLAQQAFEQELRAEQVLHLLAEVKDRLPLFQRYYRVLGETIGPAQGLQKLRSCDLSAPLRSQDWEVDWDKGQAILLEALAPLGEEMTSKVQAFFTQRWIHATPLKGKSSGAFCAPTASQHPYVLMNWNGNLYSLTALAHELGHGLHFYETVQEQHVLHLMPPLFLAETASTLNEYLLADHLIRNSDSVDDQRYFLSDLLQRLLNGIFRQSQISEFEVWAHSEGNQRQLDAEALQAKWFELARERGGEALNVLELEAAGWSRIPHLFMYPFYCYNYTLSTLIVLALIHQYQHDREAFVARYRSFLRCGGGSSPAELLNLLGLDLDSEGFYADAFDVLEGLISRLEALTPSKHSDPTISERGES